MSDDPKDLEAKIDQAKRLTSLANDPTTRERLKLLLAELVRELGSNASSTSSGNRPTRH
jgi:hypothetical protein